MNGNVQNYSTIQQLFDLEQAERYAGAGAVSSFLSAADINPLDQGIAVFDGVKLASSGKAFSGTASISQGVKIIFPENYVENYIENTARYLSLLNVPLGGNIKILTFGLKQIGGAEGTNDILETYQEKVDAQAEQENTKELLDQICQQYCGKNADECTEEEIIAAVDKYINEQVKYKEEGSNELADLNDLVNQLLGGGSVEGDCEEIALLKAALLKAAGIDAELGFTVNDQGVVDHVVVIAGGQILNNEGGGNVTLADIALKTSHDGNGNVVVLGADGKENTTSFLVNTQKGEETGGGSGPAGGALEAVGQAGETEAALNEGTLGFDDSEYIEDDTVIYDGKEYKTGYVTVNGEALEKWALKMLAKANVLSAFLIVLSSQFEAKRIADEVFTGVEREPAGKNSYKQAFIKKVQSMQKVIAVATTKVYEIANKKNTETLQAKQKKNEDEMNSCSGKFENVISFGQHFRDVALNSARETEHALEISQKNLKAMQEVNTAIIKFLQDTEGEGAMQSLGMISSLKKFDSKLKELNKKVDENLAKTREKIDDLEDQGFWAGIGNMFKGLFEMIGGLFDGIFNNDWDLLQEGAGDFIEGIKNTALAIVTFALDFIGMVFQGLAWLLAYVWPPAAAVLSAVGTAFRSAADVVDWVAQSLDFNDWAHGGGWTNDIDHDFQSRWRDANWLPAWMDNDDGENKTSDNKKDNVGEGALDYETINMIKLIQDYRGSLVAGQNAYRMYMSLKFFGRDMRNTAREKMTGFSSASGNVELILMSAEGMMGNAIRTFDATATQIMTKVSLNNQLAYNAKTIAAMNRAELMNLVAMAAAVAAVVLGILAIINPAFLAGALLAVKIAAAACGVASGVAAAGAVVIQSEIKSYDPIEADYQSTVSGFGNGGVVLDGLNKLEKEEEAYLRAAAHNSGFYIQTKDDLYTFNSKAWAVTEMKMNIINNAIRSIFSLLKNGRDLRRIVDAEFTGSAPMDSGSAFLQNAVENILMQRQVILQAVKFQIMEKITAKNISKQNELAADKAFRIIAWTLAGVALGAGIGAIVGGLPAIMVGIGLGSALASASGQLYEAAANKARGMDLVIDNKELDRLLQKRGEKSTEGKLDDAEKEAYQQLLSDEAIVSTGDGFSGVNFGLVTKVYSRLGAIYQAKEMLARARAFRSELRSLAKQQMTGITLGSSGELALSVSQASFTTAMKVASSLVQFQQSRVAVLNRARAAEKALTQAGIMFGVTAAMAGTGFTSLAISGGVQTTASFAVASLTSSAMSFVNAVMSLIFSSVDAGGDKGAYQNYSAKTTVDQTGKKINKADTIDEKIDKAEYETMLDMNSSLMVNVDGLSSVVGPGAARLSTRIQVLNNLRRALATARSMMSEARRAAGGATLSIDYGKDFVEQQEQIAQAMLDSLKGALETIAQRESQLSEAAFQASMASIQVVISASVLGFAIAGEVANQKSAEIKAPAANENRPLTDLEKTAAKPYDDKATAMRYSAGIAEALSVAISLSAEAYLADKGEEGRSKINGKSEKKETAQKDEKTDKKEKKDYFSSMDSLDEQDRALDYRLAVIESGRTSNAYMGARYDRIMNEIQGLIRATIAIFPQEEEKVAQYTKDDQAKIAVPNDPQIDQVIEEANRQIAAELGTPEYVEARAKALQESAEVANKAIVRSDMSREDYNKSVPRENQLGETAWEAVETERAKANAAGEVIISCAAPEGRQVCVAATQLVSGQDGEVGSDNYNAKVNALNEMLNQYYASVEKPNKPEDQETEVVVGGVKSEEPRRELERTLTKETADVTESLADRVADEAVDNHAAQTAHREKEKIAPPAVNPPSVTPLSALFVTNNQEPPPNTNGLKAYADSIESNLGVSVDNFAEATATVKQAGADVSKIEENIEIVSQQISEAPDEAKPDLQAQLAAIKQELKEKRAKLDQAIDNHKALLAKKEAYDGKKAEIIGKFENDLMAVRARGDKIAEQIAQLELKAAKLAPEQKVELAQLKAEQKTLPAEKGLFEHAKVEIEKAALVLVREIKGAKEMMAGLKGEIVGLQRQVAACQSAISQASLSSGSKRAAKPEVKDEEKREVSSGGTTTESAGDNKGHGLKIASAGGKSGQQGEQPGGNGGFFSRRPQTIQEKVAQAARDEAMVYNKMGVA